MRPGCSFKYGRVVIIVCPFHTTSVCVCVNIVVSRRSTSSSLFLDCSLLTVVRWSALGVDVLLSFIVFSFIYDRLCHLVETSMSFSSDVVTVVVVVGVVMVGWDSKWWYIMAANTIKERA